MQTELFRILAINPGSSSTKVAFFENDDCRVEENIQHDPADLQPFVQAPMGRQLNFRLKTVQDFCRRNKIVPGDLHAVVGRGGLLKALASGTYGVNKKMLADLERADRGEHASNLGAMLAAKLVHDSQAMPCIVDPVSVDEWQPVARLSGLQGMDRECLSHALNTKAIAKRFAGEIQQKYEDLRLIIAHLGSGISISAHENGRMLDVTNPRDEGAFSPERAGGLPVMPLIDACFSGEFSKKEMIDRIFKQGGLFSYLGFKDIRRLIEMCNNDDAQADLVFSAMVYQIGKEIGAMATVLRGKVDAILLTGGMAHSAEIIAAIRDNSGWIAPVHVYAGEEELRALADGALRVLRGEETLKQYQ